MSDVSLDYSDDSTPSESSRGSPASRRSNDKPLWNKKNSSESRSSSASSSVSTKSSSNRIRKRSPIRAPSISPDRRRRSKSPRQRDRNNRSRSPKWRKRSFSGSRSPARQMSRSPMRRRSRSPRRSPVRRQRSPMRNRLSRPNIRNSRSRSPPPRRSRSPFQRRRQESGSRSRSPVPKRRSRSPLQRRRRDSNSRSRSPPNKRSYRRRRSESPDEKGKEDEMWKKCRERRSKIQLTGERSVWGTSPSQREIEETYRIREEAEGILAEHSKKGEQLKADREKARKKEERKRNKLSDDDDESSDSSDSEVEKKKKKSKKSKKEKKSKKSKKEKKAKKEKKEKKSKLTTVQNGESSDEWEERPSETNGIERMDDDGSYSPGPPIPEHIKNRDDLKERLNSTVASYGKDLLKGEGAGMAAYVARGERIPRRGEIGLSSSEIEQYEKWGYVMSGSRHKAMEATRLRKENQILTAEEKRLLSGVSMEAKKKKEEAVMDQFRSLIENKNMRS